MSKPANTIRIVNQQRSKRSPGRKTVNGIGRHLHNLLDGSFLNRKNPSSWVPFIFFLASLGLIYIGNNYVAEKKIREINRLNGQIKEMGFNHLHMKTRLNEKTRASQLAKDLEKRGIKPLVEPPEKIFIKK